MELTKNDKLFKESIGAFIIASSEMDLLLPAFVQYLGSIKL